MAVNAGVRPAYEHCVESAGLTQLAYGFDLLDFGFDQFSSMGILGILVGV